MDERQQVAEALRLLTKRCPRLAKRCYWAGTSAVAMEELDHRRSFDLDFHTRSALEDVRPILAEIQASFPGKVQVVQAPDEFGSGFRVVLSLPGDTQITLEVLSNFEDIEKDLAAYTDVSPRAASEVRDLLLRWLSEESRQVRQQ